MLFVLGRESVIEKLSDVDGIEWCDVMHSEKPTRDSVRVHTHIHILDLAVIFTT